MLSVPGNLNLSDQTSQSLYVGDVGTGAKYFGGGNPNAGSRDSDKMLIGGVVVTILVIGALALRGN